MATKYLRGAGTGSWNTDASWSTTSSAGPANTTKPVAADTVIMDAGSTVNCTVDVMNQACATISCTGYMYTFTMNYNLTTTGNVTLSSSMVFVPNLTTWNLGCATVTLVTGGKHFYNLNFNISGTLTLSDTCYVNNVVSVVGGIAVVLLTNDITCGGLTVNGSGSISGTGRTINLTGGTWQHPSLGWIATNLTITGNVIIGTNVFFKTGVLDSHAATLTTTGSTLNIAGSSTFTDNVNIWNNINFTAASTLTLSQDTTINGNLSAASIVATLAGHNISLAGNLTTTGNGYFIGQTITMIGNVAGTATWSSGAGLCRSNITFMSGSNIITISGTVGYATGTITYTSGVMVTTGSTLQITFLSTAYTPTLNTSTMAWDAISISSSGGYNEVITINSNLRCASLITTSNGSLYMVPVTMAASTVLTVTSAIQLNNAILQSASGTCYLNYTGPQSGNNSGFSICTNVNASGSSMPVYNWNGTQTNCVNVRILTGADIKNGTPTMSAVIF
jgi:hypothetical protein